MAANRRGRPRGRPADNPEDREQQLISLAYDRAEEQLRDGTASSQLITSLVRSGSERDRLERKKIENENLLLSAKVDQLASAKKTEELMQEAIYAFGVYSGQVTVEDEDEYDE